jgi:hypothetical protein
MIPISEMPWHGYDVHRVKIQYQPADGLGDIAIFLYDDGHIGAVAYDVYSDRTLEIRAYREEIDKRFEIFIEFHPEREPVSAKLS